MSPNPSFNLLSTGQRSGTLVALVFCGVILVTGALYVVHRDSVYWEYRAYLQQNEESNRLTTRSEAQERIGAFNRSVSNNVAFRTGWARLYDCVDVVLKWPKNDAIRVEIAGASGTSEPSNEFLDTGATSGTPSGGVAAGESKPAGSSSSGTFGAFAALQTLKAAGAKPLYIQVPGKYSVPNGEFGMDDYYGDVEDSGSGDVMAEMRVESLQHVLAEQGVPVLDLRSALVSEGRNPVSVFPETDRWSADTTRWVLNTLRKALETHGIPCRWDWEAACEKAETQMAEFSTADAEETKSPSRLTNPDAPNAVRVLIIGDATRLLLANGLLAGCGEVQTCDFNDEASIRRALAAKPDVVLEMTCVDTWK